MVSGQCTLYICKTSTWIETVVDCIYACMGSTKFMRMYFNLEALSLKTGTWVLDKLVKCILRLGR